MKNTSKHPFVSALCAVCLLASAAALSAGVATGAESPNKAEAEIRSQIQGYAAARQKGDGQAQAQFYTPDADEWRAAAREMVRGRAAIAKDLFVAQPAGSFTLDPVQISFLKPDVALVDALFGSGGEIGGHAFYVMVNTDGRWLIRSARMTRFPLPTTANPPPNEKKA
jgi:uncharacterized protein (TIGR02246 family)